MDHLDLVLGKGTADHTQLSLLLEPVSNPHEECWDKHYPLDQCSGGRFSAHISPVRKRVFECWQWCYTTYAFLFWF